MHAHNLCTGKPGATKIREMREDAAQSHPRMSIREAYAPGRHASPFVILTTSLMHRTS